MTAQPMFSSPPTAGGVQIGTVLCDKYHILRELGVGGMGVVWVARDQVLDVEVALKVIEPGAADPDFKQRALTEARLAARLVHPAVCRAVDFGLSEGGAPFVVSELLNGESLDLLLEREGRMPAVEAVRALLPILDALQTAHDAGIIHRDVKPANLFLARVGPQRIQPKLLDFGVACLLEERQRTKASGRIYGTPAYMSPEQARGEKQLDARSDVWGLCVTLYELVTGVSPFDRDSCNAVLWAVQTVNPLPITDLGVAEPALAQIIARGLERERSARFRSAAELGRELARWLLSVGEETDATGHSLRARLLDSLHDADELSDVTDPTAVLPSNPAAARASSLPAPGRAARVGRMAMMGLLLTALVSATHWWQASRVAAGRQEFASAPVGARPAAPRPITPIAAPAPDAITVPLSASAIAAEPAAAQAQHRSVADRSDFASRPMRKRPAPLAPAERAGFAPSPSQASHTPSVALANTEARSRSAAQPGPASAAASAPVPRKSNNALHFDFGL